MRNANKERLGDANVCFVEIDERTADHTCRHAKYISARRLILPEALRPSNIGVALPIFDYISIRVLLLRIQFVFTYL